MIELAINIPVDYDKVWSILLDKVWHPEIYIPGVETYSFIKQTDEEVLRKLFTESGTEVMERITIDKEGGKIVHFLVKHPYFQGNLAQKLDKTVEGCRLNITQDWVSKDGVNDEEGMRKALGQALDDIKVIAEAEHEQK